jgi:hypothetical protein
MELDGEIIMGEDEIIIDEDDDFIFSMFDLSV